MVRSGKSFERATVLHVTASTPEIPALKIKTQWVFFIKKKLNR